MLIQEELKRFRKIKSQNKTKNHSSKRQSYTSERNSYTSQSKSDSKNFDLFNLSEEDAFEILEVSELSTSQEIKNSRNRLINQWHPDKHKTRLYQNIAEKQTKLIIIAYELLRELGYVD